MSSVTLVTSDLILAATAGRASVPLQGEVDLIWINGENFKRAKQNNLLCGPPTAVQHACSMQLDAWHAACNRKRCMLHLARRRMARGLQHEHVACRVMRHRARLAVAHASLEMRQEASALCRVALRREVKQPRQAVTTAACVSTGRQCGESIDRYGPWARLVPNAANFDFNAPQANSLRACARTRARAQSPVRVAHRRMR